MLIAARTPGPPLSAFVELLWLYETDVPHAAEALLPTGSMELIVTLRAPKRELLLAGPYSRPALLDTSEPSLVLGAHFDFRAFAGMSPSRYLAARGDHLNHVPLHHG